MCKDCGCGGEHTHEGHAHGMDVHVPVLDANDRLAERNRGFFEAKKLLVINVFSSPGSGKTSSAAKDGGDVEEPCQNGGDCWRPGYGS